MSELAFDICSVLTRCVYSGSRFNVSYFRAARSCPARNYESTGDSIRDLHEVAVFNRTYDLTGLQQMARSSGGNIHLKLRRYHIQSCSLLLQL